jgi:hypothetical protein
MVEVEAREVDEAQSLSQERSLSGKFSFGESGLDKFAND